MITERPICEIAEAVISYAKSRGYELVRDPATFSEREDGKINTIYRDNDCCRVCAVGANMAARRASVITHGEADRLAIGIRREFKRRKDRCTDLCSLKTTEDLWQFLRDAAQHG